MKVTDIINTITAQKHMHRTGLLCSVILLRPVLPELCDLDSRSTSSCLARLAVEVAAKKHCQMGVPMVVWKNGKILEFLPQRKISIESTDRFFKV